MTMLIMIIITTRTTWNERTTWNTQKRLHPLEAKSKNQTQRMELKHRGVTNEIKLFSAISATRERWFVWHGNFILFEEPNPSGSRPSDLIGLEEQHMKPHPPQHTRKGKEKAQRRARPPGGSTEPLGGGREKRRRKKPKQQRRGGGRGGSKIPRSDTDEPDVTSCTTRQERERWFTTFSPPNRSASTCRGAHFE